MYPCWLFLFENILPSASLVPPPQSHPPNHGKLHPALTEGGDKICWLWFWCNQEIFVLHIQHLDMLNIKILKAGKHSVVVVVFLASILPVHLPALYGKVYFYLTAFRVLLYRELKHHLRSWYTRQRDYQNKVWNLKIYDVSGTLKYVFEVWCF